jgi:hypothetical protein
VEISAFVSSSWALSRRTRFTATGTWWLDVDAAEAANPGMFIGKPLNITLSGAEDTGGPSNTSLTATLTARVQKK